ncbi:hypothetical protein [Ruegeria meonggei]|uniref:hypothetical protein n=1 Tax=Ruegeria meonggei TaxID=1446476 RepID=UPI0036711113
MSNIAGKSSAALLLGGKLVLNVICGRQIHDARFEFPQQLDTGGKNKLEQLGRVDFGHGHDQPFAGSFDAMFGLGRRSRTFRGKGYSAQLVFGRDNGHVIARDLELRKDGRRTQNAHVVHHHFFATVRVNQVIAAGVQISLSEFACGFMTLLWSLRSGSQLLAAISCNCIHRSNRLFG